MSRLHWYLSRRLDRLPILTLFAWLSVLTLVAAMIWLLTLIQNQPVEQTVSPADKTESVTAVIRPGQQTGDELLAGAPKLAQITLAIETLYRVAEQHQLRLQEVVYQDQHTQGEPLVQYAIDFSVQQRYPQIKAFLTQLLATLPYLALEQVSFERHDIQGGQIQSHFRFKLFLERENG